jgi:ribosomal protein L37AE/L43A
VDSCPFCGCKDTTRMRRNLRRCRGCQAVYNPNTWYIEVGEGEDQVQFVPRKKKKRRRHK